ncbi:MAG: FtsX-like permease family protein [candidate division WOR-3 bacterium]
MLFKGAIRNSLKYLRRSIVIAICIAVSTIAMQTMSGIGEGFKISALRFMLSREGMIVFEPKDAEPLEVAIYSIEKYGDIKKKIKEIIPNAEIRGKIFAPAIVVKDSSSIETSIISEDEIPRTIIGEKTAEILNAKKGDTIILFGSNRYGGLSVLPAKIDSTAKNFKSIKNGKGIILPISLMRMLLGWEKDEVRLLVINFYEFWKADEYVKELRKIFPNIKITSWRERLTNIEDLFRVTDYKMNIFSLIILILVAGIIMNTVLTSVLERKKDIGTLRAIGASRFWITKLILLEIILISLIGALIGTIFSYIIIKFGLGRGISFGEIEEMMDYWEGKIYPAIVPLQWVGYIVFGVIWAIIWSLYPLLYIVRMKPIEALKKEL